MAPSVLVRLGFRDVEGRLRIPIHPVHGLYELGTFPSVENYRWTSIALLEEIPLDGPQPSVDIVGCCWQSGEALAFEDVEGRLLVILGLGRACWIAYYNDAQPLVARMKQARAQGRPAMVNQARVLRRYFFENEYLPAIIHLQDYTPRITSEVLADKKRLTTEGLEALYAMERWAEHARVYSSARWVGSIFGTNVSLDPGVVLVPGEVSGV